MRRNRVKRVSVIPDSLSREEKARCVGTVGIMVTNKATEYV